MSYLEVPGASLYFEAVGEGPMLLCITGAFGSVEPFRDLADCLKSHFTVVMYDRRGYSRSFLSATEAQDYENRIQTDADDAALLIKHLSPHEPATVLGSSSGAVVSLELLVRHPDVIKTLIAHEPPAHSFLPEFQEIAAGIKELYQLYRQRGVPPAMEMFSKTVKMEGTPEAPFLMQSVDPRNGPYVSNNVQYWFEREMDYPNRQFDIELLRASQDKLVLGAGELTNKEAWHHRTNFALAEKLGVGVKMFPGAHLGFASHPNEFASKLLTVLSVPN